MFCFALVRGIKTVPDMCPQQSSNAKYICLSTHIVRSPIQLSIKNQSLPSLQPLPLTQVSMICFQTELGMFLNLVKTIIAKSAKA